MCPVAPVELGNVFALHDSPQKRSAAVMCLVSWTGDQAHSSRDFISVPESFVVRLIGPSPLTTCHGKQPYRRDYAISHNYKIAWSKHRYGSNASGPCSEGRHEGMLVTERRHACIS